MFSEGSKELDTFRPWAVLGIELHETGRTLPGECIGIVSRFRLDHRLDQGFVHPVLQGAGIDDRFGIPSGPGHNPKV